VTYEDRRLLTVDKKLEGGGSFVYPDILLGGYDMI
jgi:hypothetical protein